MTRRNPKPEKLRLVLDQWRYFSVGDLLRLSGSSSGTFYVSGVSADLIRVWPARPSPLPRRLP